MLLPHSCGEAWFLFINMNRGASPQGRYWERFLFFAATDLCRRGPECVDLMRFSRTQTAKSVGADRLGDGGFSQYSTLKSDRAPLWG